MWERKWSHPGFEPPRSIPEEVQQAVSEGWFPPGTTALDIGCGSGEIAAWLAARGYDVLGVDFAEAAIDRARVVHEGVPGLAFEVIDICEAPPERAGFGVLLDRGCLQGIPTEAAPDYARNVAAAASQNARFLLLHRLHPRSSADETTRNLEALFRGTFELVRTADTVMGSRPAEDPAEIREPVHGVACWLVRRRQ